MNVWLTFCTCFLPTSIFYMSFNIYGLWGWTVLNCKDACHFSAWRRAAIVVLSYLAKELWFLSILLFGDLRFFFFVFDECKLFGNLWLSFWTDYFFGIKFVAVTLVRFSLQTSEYSTFSSSLLNIQLINLRFSYQSSQFVLSIDPHIGKQWDHVSIA